MGMEGSDGGYGYGYGGEGSTGGYGGYGGYGGSSTGRRLTEQLEPEDPLLPQQQEASPAAAAAAAAPEEHTAAQVAAAAAQHPARQQFVMPAGSCYCRFDTDFNTFAIADGACKDALYQRCKVGT
jgi:hypothetical protein